MKKIFLLLSLCCFFVPVHAVDGALDLTFAGGTGFMDALAGFEPLNVTVQTDGKIIVLGFDSIGNDQLARYNNNGTLDTTFGTGGVVINTIGFSNAMLVQPDGKIVITGTDSFGNIQLVRYNTNGTIDTSFGIGGYATGPSGSANTILIQPDQKLVIGSANGTTWNLVRFNTNGTVDTIFQSTAGAFVSDLTQQANGKIIVGGVDNSTLFKIVRYNTNGTIDLVYVPGPMGLLTGVVIQTNGKVVGGGYTFIGGNNFEIARWDITGFLDPTFGTAASGFFVGPPGIVGDIVLQADEKAILMGADPAATQFKLVRYTTAGLIDLSFGTLGSVTGPAGQAFGGALQEDGKIIAVGNDPTVSNFQVARHLNSPALTPTQILIPTSSVNLPAGNTVFSGTAQSPSTIYLFLNGVFAASTTTDPLGSNTWTLTSTIPTTGTYSVEVVSLYRNGNINQSSTIILPPTPQPPSSFTGIISSTTFLNTKECLLNATWSASLSSDIIAYRIFRSNTLLVEVPATSALAFSLCVQTSVYSDCCTSPAFATLTIAAVNSDNMVSEAIPLEIRCS